MKRLLCKLKAFVCRFIPEYSLFPLGFAFLFNCFTYFLSRIITSFLPHHDITSRFDSLIPVIPVFVVVYWLSYIQWYTTYIVVARESRKFCYRIMSAEIIAKAICLVIFIVFPTTMVRPEISGNGAFSWMTRFLYSIDTNFRGIPDNLLPSIHCLESWFCLRAALKMKKPPVWYKISQIVFCVLVFFCVLFVKQHILIDVVAGVLVFEIAMLISKITKADRLFLAFEKKFLRSSDLSVD